MSDSINKLDETLEQMVSALSEDRNWIAHENPFTPRSGMYGKVTDTDETQPIKNPPAELGDETQPIKALKMNITRIVHGQPPSGPFKLGEKVPSPTEQAALRAAEQRKK